MNDVTVNAEVKAENEKKKWYLRSYIRACRQQNRIEEDIKALRLDKMCPSVVLDNMPHGSGGKDLSDYIVRLDKLERKYLKQRYRRIAVRTEIRDKIEHMEDENEKDVLTLRYIQNVDWKDICIKMGYSWQHVHRIHSEALKNFKM